MNDALDPAAIFACALSLWNECMRPSRNEGRINFSECYNGGDEFMRVLMRTGTRFEEWACAHVAFEHFDEVWPYLLEERFGTACAKVQGVEALDQFDDETCLRVALRLRLPLNLSTGLPVPVNVVAENPVAGSEFVRFRIQTVRFARESDVAEAFTLDGDPFDEEFGEPVYTLYGVFDDDTLEMIADRDTFADAVKLARQLAPGILLPDFPLPAKLSERP